VVRLFQRIRDESHRFAVSYHTVLKRKKQNENALEEIPGIGPQTRRKLIKAFGSMRALQTTPLDQIADVIGKSKAQQVNKYLQRP